MGLPGLRGTEHIGFTVPDLDEAHRFLTEVVGATLVYELGPFERARGDWMRRQLNVHPRSVMRRLNFYRCANGTNFEVFQWEPADGQQDQPRNSDIGGHHLAFYVDDIDTAVGYLKERGVQVLGEPVSSRGASAGQRWVYFLAPWGMQFELVTFPHGKAYEKEAPVILWNPTRPQE